MDHDAGQDLEGEQEQPIGRVEEEQAIVVQESFVGSESRVFVHRVRFVVRSIEGYLFAQYFDP